MSIVSNSAASGESLFLRYKDKLDRVLYSLLRVQDSFQCQEIYYAIEANEISFSEAASLIHVDLSQKRKELLVLLT